MWDSSADSCRSRAFCREKDIAVLLGCTFLPKRITEINDSCAKLRLSPSRTRFAITTALCHHERSEGSAPCLCHHERSEGSASCLCHHERSEGSASCLCHHERSEGSA